MNRLASLHLALCFLAPASAAQVIDVPGDHATPQEAIDSAPAGAVIRIHGGYWPSITIDRPLTIIGPAHFEGINNFSSWGAPITMAGPGSGRVVLSNVSTGTECVRAIYLLDLPAGIEGGGFAELHVLDSQIRPPTIGFFDGGLCAPISGEVEGAPGIETSVPTIVIERSQVRGGLSDNDDDGTGLYVDGPPGILAPESHVLALDSFVRGGSAGDYWSYPAGTCDSFFWACKGSGGDALVAAALHQVNSQLRGGSGATWHGRENFGDPYELCDCTGPNGAEAVTAVPPVRLRSTLDMPAPPQIGTTLTLVHHGSHRATLIASFDLRLPVRIPQARGLYFLDPSPIVIGRIANGPVSLTVPFLPALIGQELAFQTLERDVGLSPPVVGLIR